MSEIQLKNVTDLEVGSTVQEYKNSFDVIARINREISEKKGEIDDLLSEYGIEMAGQKMVYGTPVVYKPLTDADEDSLIVVDSMYGKHLMDSVVDPEVMRVLEKRFSGIGKFLENCHKVWQERHSKREREIDEKRNEKFQKEYKKLNQELRALQDELQLAVSKKNSLEEQVDFVSKLANIKKVQNETN